MDGQACTARDKRTDVGIQAACHSPTAGHLILDLRKLEGMKQYASVSTDSYETRARDRSWHLPHSAGLRETVRHCDPGEH